MSSETTFERDLTAIDTLNQVLAGLSDKTASRLRSKRLLAGVVQVKIRRSDFVTNTRQCTVQPATNVTRIIYEAAVRLLSEWRQEQPDAAVRLLGVGTSRFASDDQMDLFSDEPGQDSGAVDKAVDAVREKFSSLGVAALRPARTLDPEKQRE